METIPKTPIKSGWRGDINGFVENTDTKISVSNIQVNLDFDTAYALCNLLTDNQLAKSDNLEKDQRVMMSQFGAALGRLIDHNAANNGGREVIK